MQYTVGWRTATDAHTDTKSVIIIHDERQYRAHADRGDTGHRRREVT